MEIQNIVNFFMFNEICYGFQILSVFFQFHTHPHTKKGNTVHAFRFSFSWEKWKTNATKKCMYGNCLLPFNLKMK